MNAIFLSNSVRNAFWLTVLTVLDSQSLAMFMFVLIWGKIKKNGQNYFISSNRIFSLSKVLYKGTSRHHSGDIITGAFLVPIYKKVLFDFSVPDFFYYMNTAHLHKRESAITYITSQRIKYKLTLKLRSRHYFMT